MPDKGMSRAEELRASPPLFSSPVLDAVTRVHWTVVPLIFVPAIAIFLYEAFVHASVATVLAGIVLGYIVWTLTEYWLHRIVFHFEPEDGIGARLHWIIHGVHHDHPNDRMRLVMPPSVSVPLAIGFYVLFLLVLGGTVAPAFGAGFLVGYLVYDMTHYHVHHHTPRTRGGRRLREAHMRHHFQDDTRGFGVSAPWWDHVFGTAPKRPTR
jgi:sterol desaturase/sphingolipid hydroxylase (fatty acid hydroxylase superfamily)